jgi:hypothetical protein
MLPETISNCCQANQQQKLSAAILTADADP